MVCRIELRFAGQVAVDQQIGHFQVARLFGELLHRIAAVQKHTRIAVDVGDLAFSARGGHEAGIESEQPLILGQARDVECFRPDGSRNGGHYAGFAALEILEFVFRAHALFRRAWMASFETSQPCTALQRNQGSPSYAQQEARADQYLSPRGSYSQQKIRVLGFRSRGILLAEFIDATAGIHNFLLAGVERMAAGTNFNL